MEFNEMKNVAPPDNISQSNRQEKPPSPFLWLNHFLSVPVITVLVTSIAAPFVTHFINSGMKNKELQINTLNNLIEMTRTANFKDIDEKYKLKLIATIIESNHDIFNLEKFQETREIFETTFNEALPGGIAALVSDIDDKKNRLSVAQTELSEVSEKLTDLSDKNTILLDQVNEFKSKLEDQENLSSGEIKKLKKNIEENINKIADNNIQIYEYDKKTRELESDVRNKTEALIQSQANLNKANEENKILSQTIKNYQKAINDKETTVEELRGQLSKALNQINEQSKRIEGFDLKEQQLSLLNSKYNESRVNLKKIEEEKEVLQINLTEKEKEIARLNRVIMDKN